MYPYEIATRLSSLDRLDYSALPATGTTLSDLDQNELARLRGIVSDSKGSDKTLLELDDSELLSALGLVTEEGGERVPTVSGMLLLGAREALARVLPTHAGAFQVLTGTDVRVNEDFGQPLLATVQRMNEMLVPWNPEREMMEGLFRFSIPEFDRRAFREAVVNAFGHRDYSRLGQVLVQVTDEGMTITNPGGFIEGVTISNILTVAPRGRNPRLMAALKRIGLAESTGRGVDRIFEGSLLYGRPLPDYSLSTEVAVSLFIARSQPDESFMELLEEERQRTGVAPSLRSMLVLDALKRQRRMSLGELSEDLHITPGVARATVEPLVEAGIVEALGDGRSRAYMLSLRVYARKDGARAHTLQSGIDRMRYDELVTKLVREQGYVANRDVVDMLHVGEKQAYAILRGLVSRGVLELRGRGAGSRYYLAQRENHQ